MDEKLLEEGYDVNVPSNGGDFLKIVEGETAKVRIVEGPIMYKKAFLDKKTNEVGEGVKFAYRVINRSDSRLQFLEASRQIFNALKALAENPEWRNPADAEEGYDVSITNNGQLPQYWSVTQGRNVTPLNEDEKEALALAQLEMPLRTYALNQSNFDPLAKA